MTAIGSSSSVMAAAASSFWTEAMTRDVSVPRAYSSVPVRASRTLMPTEGPRAGSASARSRTSASLAGTGVGALESRSASTVGDAAGLGSGTRVGAGPLAVAVGSGVGRSSVRMPGTRSYTSAVA